MSGKMFWGLAVILLAVAVHISFILFVPPIEMEKKLQVVDDKIGRNALTVLERSDARTIIVQGDDTLIHAVCLYDLSDGAVKVSAAIPDTYWSMNIYTSRGNSIYTVNDKQAEAKEFSIVIEQADTSGEAAGEPAATQVPPRNAFKVQSAEPQGLVVMRALVPHQNARSRIKDVMRASNCIPLASRNARLESP